MSEDEPTQRLGPPGYTRPGAYSGYDDEQRTAVLNGSRSLPEPSYEPEDPDRLPRWGLPLIIGVVSFIAGAVLALLLTGGNATVSPETLAAERARANEALQDAQAQISDRDAQIAALQGQLADVDADRQAALSAQQEALETQRQALEDREAALDAREQALNDREQAGQGGPAPEPDLPGVDLPDVNLPDVELPDSEESRNLLEQLVDGLRRLFD
jgi:hypothetical protein